MEQVFFTAVALPHSDRDIEELRRQIAENSRRINQDIQELKELNAKIQAPAK